LSISKFSNKSDLEKIYSLAKMATKIQIIIYIVFTVVVFVTSVLSFVGLQADGCITRYQVKRSNNHIKIPGSSSKLIKADGNYSKYNINFPGNKNCPDCFEWLDSEIEIDTDIKKLGQIYLSVSGNASLCASYLMENNIHKDGKQRFDKNNNPIRIPKVYEDADGLILNILSKKEDWGNLIYMQKDDDLNISLVSSKIVKETDPITGNEIFADCSTENGIRSNVGLCGKYSYQVSNGCQCSSNKQSVKGCKYQGGGYYGQFFIGDLFDQSSRVINYTDDGFFVVMRNNYDYIHYINNQSALIQNPVDYEGTTKGRTNFFNEYKNYKNRYQCFRIGSSKTGAWPFERIYHDSIPSIGFNRKLWQDHGVNTYKGMDYEVDYFNYSKVKQRAYIDSAFINSGCFMKDFPCDYNNTGQYSDSALEEFSSHVGFDAKNGQIYKPYPDNNSDLSYVKKLWLSNGTGIIFRFVGNNDYLNTGDYSQDDGSYGFFSEPLSNGEIKINYEKDNYKPDTANNRYLQLKLYKPKNVGKNLGIGGYLLKIKHSPCATKNGATVDFLQDSETVAYDEMSIKLGKNILDATNTFNKMGIDQFDNIIKNTDMLFYIKIMLIIYVMLLGAGIASGNISMNSYELFIRFFKIVIVGGLFDKSTFGFFIDYLYPIMRDLPKAILVGAISGDYTVDPSGSSDVLLPILNYFCLIFSETFLSASFFPKIMSIMVSGFGGLVLLSIVFSIVLISLAVCKYIVVFISAVVFNGLLLGFAPIFLTFILFEKTKYLFDNWVKYLVSYVVEPTISGLGLIVFVNLFLIYIDSILNYSVCFKCYIPISIPISSLEINLFCMSWFLPWGSEFDILEFLKSFPKTVSDSIVLLIISSSAYRYHSLALELSSKISGAAGTSMAQFASKASNIKDIMKDFDQKMERTIGYKGVKNFAKYSKETYKESRRNYKANAEGSKYSPKSIYNNTINVAKSLVSAPVGGAVGTFQDIKSGVKDTKESISKITKNSKSLMEDISNKKFSKVSKDLMKSGAKKILGKLRSKD